jgi:hypothetical protein
MEKKRKLLEDARRSGGVFGAAELALLEGSEDDNEHTEGGTGDEANALAIAQTYDVGLGTTTISAGTSTTGTGTGTGSVPIGDSSTGITGAAAAPLSAATNADIKSHVPVPSQDEIGVLVFDHKKKLMLEKYA